MPAPKTLAQRHFETVTADQAVTEMAATGQVTGRAASAYEMLRLKLAEDRRSLKTVESISLKIERKRDLLPYYEDWVNAVLQNGTGAPDDVLMTVMLWRLDVADFAGALAIGRYALKHGLRMPETHGRKTPTVLAEEVADTTRRLLTEGKPVDRQLIRDTLDLTLPHDMADEVRAKLFKVAGLVSEETDPAYALEQFREALRLNEKAGVKQNIARLEKQLGTQTDSEADSQATNQTPADPADTES